MRVESCQETQRWMNDEELQARVPKAVKSRLR